MLAAAYRASPNASTGLTPNLLMLGKEVRLPAELMFGSSTTNSEHITSYGEYVDQLKSRLQKSHNVARKYLETYSKRQKDMYDTNAFTYGYKTGDVVWCLNESRKPGISPKLQPAYYGPCVITEKIDDLRFKVQSEQRQVPIVMNHNKLKIYEGQNTPHWIKTLVKKLKQ